jgi:hypothetical protein
MHWEDVVTYQVMVVSILLIWHLLWVFLFAALRPLKDLALALIPCVYCLH